MTANASADLTEMAATHAGRSAFLELDGVGGRRRTSFAELHAMVAEVAGGLAARGVGPGDAVVLFVPMSRDLYVVLLAVLRLGAVAVFIDPWAGRSFIEHAADLVAPRAFVAVPRAHALRLTSRALRRAPVQVVATPGVAKATAASGVVRASGAISLARLAALGAASPITDAAPVEPDQTALITFTSGTSGRPKGADRTHGMLLAQHRELAAHVDQAPGDIHVSNLPIFALHNLASGVTTVLPPAGMAQDPSVAGSRLANVIGESAATILTLSPAPLDTLCRWACGDDGDPATLASVARIYTGGGPVTPALCERAATAMPSASLEAFYGSTESEPIAAMAAPELISLRERMQRDGGLPVGVPVAATDTVLVPESSDPMDSGPGGTVEELEVPAGSPGEVVVAGEHVNRSYIRNPDAVRANKIVDAAGRVWHRTGDMARRDEDGRLWLVGRVGTGVTVRDEVVFPMEVEAPLEDSGNVARAALVAVDGAPVLAIEVRPGELDLGLRAARALLDARGIHEVPIRHLPAIPVDARHATKIDRPALVRLLSGQGR